MEEGRALVDGLRRPTDYHTVIAESVHLEDAQYD